MIYGEPLDSILNFLSSIFLLPAEWLGFPQVIFFLIIPLVGLIILWSTFLNNFLKIFKSSTVNYGIAVIISLFSTPFIRIFTPTYIIGLAVGGSFIFYGGIKTWKMIVSIILFFVTILAYPSILSIIGLKY